MNSMSMYMISFLYYLFDLFHYYLLDLSQNIYYNYGHSITLTDRPYL